MAPRSRRPQVSGAPRTAPPAPSPLPQQLDFQIFCMRNPVLVLAISQCRAESPAGEMAALLAFAERLGASPRDLEMLLARLLDG